MRNSTLKLAATAAFALTLGAASLAHASSAGQYMDDASITTKVKAALLSDQQLKATQVSVTTDQGTVQLSGMVNSPAQESEAVRVANRIDGVQSVQDMMTVRGTQSQ